MSPVTEDRLHRIGVVALLAIAFMLMALGAVSQDRVVYGPGRADSCVYVAGDWSPWSDCIAHLEEFHVVDTTDGRLEIRGSVWRYEWRQVRTRVFGPVEARCALRVPGLSIQTKPCPRPRGKRLPPNPPAVPEGMPIGRPMW